MHLGKQKIWAAVILVGALSVLWIAWTLQPDARGYGTHQQIHLPTIAGVTLHLPPCVFQTVTGLPCATCGMTTAFAYAAHGHLRQAVAAQPFGFVLFLVTLGGAVDSAVFLATDKSLRHVTLPWKRIWIWGLVLFLACWGYKVLMVLRHPAS